MENKKTIYIGGDHASYKTREKLEKYLYDCGYTIISLGSNNDEVANYAEYAIKVGEMLIKNPNSLGLVLCGSGIGVNIAINKVKGVRSALVFTKKMAQKAKKKKFNAIAIGTRFINFKNIIKIVDQFLNNKSKKQIGAQYTNIDLYNKADFTGTNNNNDSIEYIKNKNNDITINDIHDSKILN